jgi:cytochrome c oxidase cbb3-type subunit 3
MHAHVRLIAAGVVAFATMIGLALARGGGPQGQAPAGQPPAQPPAAGRGEDTGQRGAGPAGAGPGGGRRGGFPQFTRELAPPDVLVRGKSLYEANCASCHASDLRGGPKGANLLRAGTALSDRHGELVGAALAKHTPALNVVGTDATAMAEYIHSIHATMSGQGSPPGRIPTGIELNVVVGDAKSGETDFAAVCAACHSLTGDLKGIGSKYPDARTLQNAWVAGSSGRFGAGGDGGRGGFGGRGGVGVGSPVTVTMADGSQLQGTLVRQDDWLVILTLPDGTRKSMARNPGMKIDIKDRTEAHKKMVLELDDPNNKKMHDVTAYLWTVK